MLLPHCGCAKRALDEIFPILVAHEWRGHVWANQASGPPILPLPNCKALRRNPRDRAPFVPAN
jgi:hypothetical protein